MMLCPACNQVYDQNQKFCEEDGTQLVSVPSVIVGNGNTGQIACQWREIEKLEIRGI